MLLRWGCRGWVIPELLHRPCQPWSLELACPSNQNSIGYERNPSAAPCSAARAERLRARNYAAPRAFDSVVRRIAKTGTIPSAKNPVLNSTL